MADQSHPETEVARTVRVTQPKQTPFNLEREGSWIKSEMLEAGRRAKEELDRETAWQQEQLNAIYEPLRRQAGAGKEGVELTRKYLIDELDCGDIERQLDETAQAMIKNEPRSAVSPRMGSCASAFAPYPADYNDQDSGGIGGMHSHLNAPTGRFGGFTFLAVGGSQWLGTGVGEWINSGNNAGTASVRADISISGRCAEYSALFGYFRNVVKVHVRTWDSEGRQFDANRTVHDNWEVIGLNIRNFSGDSFSPAVSVPIQANRWYLVWAWAEQFTVCGGLADGGTHLWMRATRLQICT